MERPSDSPYEPGEDDSDDREPSGGKPQEKVEDRPNVSTVTPEDYPKDLPDH